jgi:hypothetical protein
MIYILRQVLSTFAKLFPKGKFRTQAIWLAVIATVVPLTQLFVIRIFSHMITRSTQEPLSKALVNFVLFFGLFGLTHIATYWQKTYRVKVFNNAISSNPDRKSKLTESWEWALAFETNNLLHTFAQMLVLAVYFIVVSWQVGLVNCVLIMGTMQFVKMMFHKQIDAQEGFALAQKKNKPATAATKVGARIRSAEIGILIANAAFIVSLAALLAFSYLGQITAADCVMLFLGFRMQNNNLGQTSGSLMRFARAKALSEAPKKYKGIKPDHDDEEEMI